MENQKQKKSVGTVLLVILLLIVTIASLILATYAWAKYTTQTEGTATAQVAKWDVTLDFQNNKFEETFEHVLDQHLAPGTSGSFDITINPGSTEVDFGYAVEILSVTNKPEHLNFYTKYDSGSKKYSEKIEIDDSGLVEDDIFTGTINQGSNSIITKTIYWDWPYENPDTSSRETDEKKISADGNSLENGQNGIPDYDDQDTIDGQSAKDVTLKMKITATQITPTAQ